MCEPCIIVGWQRRVCARSAYCSKLARCWFTFNWKQKSFQVARTSALQNKQKELIFEAEINPLVWRLTKVLLAQKIQVATRINRILIRAIPFPALLMCIRVSCGNRTHLQHISNRIFSPALTRLLQTSGLCECKQDNALGVSSRSHPDWLHRSSEAADVIGGEAYWSEDNQSQAGVVLLNNSKARISARFPYIGGAMYILKLGVPAVGHGGGVHVRVICGAGWGSKDGGLV